MGTGYKGNSPTFRSVGENIESVSSKYHYHEGRFGVRGSKKNKVRHIASEKPLETAKDFYDKLAYGGKEDIYEKEKMKITRMADGTVITYRETSTSDGTPVVEINIDNSGNCGGVKSQKIHFIEEKK